MKIRVIYKSLLQFISFVCMGVLSPSVCALLARLVPQRPEEGTTFPGTGIPDCCESPCGYWELHLGALEEAPVL